MSEPQVKEGDLYQERNGRGKFPRIIRVRKITKMGSDPYVYFVAENQVAQSIHPNGGMIPLESFFEAWTPVKS